MLKGYPLELLVLEGMQNEGIRMPAALVERTGKSAGEVDIALRRIRRYTKRILDAERGEDARAEGGNADENEEVA